MPTIGAGSKVTLKGTLLLLAALALPLVGCSSPAAPTQVFVDPSSGQDTHPGTQERPLKTLKKALEAAVGPVRTVVLLAGTYDGASGETWGYTVPDGITVKANSAGVILSGFAGKTGLTLSGGAALSFLTLRNFAVAVQADAGTPTLTGVTFADNTLGLKLSGSVRATVSEVSFGGKPTDSVSSLTLEGEAQATLNTPVFTDSTGILAKGRSRLTVNGGTLERVGVSRNISDPSVAPVLNALTLWDSATAALNGPAVRNCLNAFSLKDPGTRLELVGGTVSGPESSSWSSGTLIIEVTRFEQVYLGVAIFGGSVSVKNARFTQSRAYALRLGGAAQLKVRGSSFDSNGTIANDQSGGVVVDGGLADLGTTADPGGNTFANGRPSLLDHGGNLTIHATGNTWDATTQGADSAGKYAAGTVVAGPASGFNFRLKAGSSIRL
ncbi:MAG: DUF1565 domain-containing protein [Meiothermus sp.]|nr:DUF1565 domain-containing protein [Meiothermus sp.]